MTADNVTPTRYREVSMATVDVDLTQPALSAWFQGLEAYRRTKFIIVLRHTDVALLEVEKASEQPLFSPITSVRLLASPPECRFVTAPETDTAVPTQLAEVARTLASGVRCVVVQGRYGHVSFLLDPAPLRVRVLETVPPEPPKLVHQLQRILDLADDLPPIQLEPRLVNLVELALGRPADRYLFPCRAGDTTTPGAQIDYLDERPPRADWTLVGCARSREIHRWCYGEDAPAVDSCPRALVADDCPTLTKCCLLEERIAVEGNVVTVPWGASLEEVRTGLDALVEVMGNDDRGQNARS